MVRGEGTLGLSLVLEIALLADASVFVLFLLGLPGGVLLLSFRQSGFERFAVFAVGKHRQTTGDHHRCNSEVSIHLGIDGYDWRALGHGTA